jgi:hypothetical protein
MVFGKGKQPSSPNRDSQSVAAGSAEMEQTPCHPLPERVVEAAMQRNKKRGFLRTRQIGCTADHLM